MNSENFYHYRDYEVRHHRHIHTPKDKGDYRRATKPRWDDERGEQLDLEEQKWS